MNPLCDFSFRGGRSFPSTFPDRGFWEVSSWDREERGCPVLFGAHRKPWWTYQKWKNNQQTQNQPREILKVLRTLLKWSAFCHKLEHMPFKYVHLQKRIGVLRLRSSQEDKELCKNTRKTFFLCVCEKKTRYKTCYIFPCSEEPRTSDEVPESWIILDKGNCLQRPEMVQRATSWVRSPLLFHNDHPVLCKVKAGKEFSPANTRCREKEEQVSIPHL